MPNGDDIDFPLTIFAIPDGDSVNFELGDEEPPTFLLGMGVSKKLGKPSMPDPLNVFGIWQMRMTKRGKVPIKMRFYTPSNPQTEAQQANRQKFADAMSAWQALTDEQKETYNVRARKRQMFGRNLFIKEYYQAN